jgi:predicted metal-dependent phosphoesterase TrpH
MHSYKSYDCVASIKSIIAHAAKRGLSGIAITDHEVLTSDDLVEVAAEHNIWLIKAIEAKTEIGDIIGLFVSKDLKSRKAEQLLDEIHDQDGIAVLAHPFKYMKDSDRYPARLLEKIDAVEIVNSRWRDLESCTKNSKVSSLLSAVKGRSAGSDAHFPFEIGRAYWQVPHVASREELKESIRSNTGQAVSVCFSTSLDGASQCIKFAKKPTLKQLARMVYWSSRRVMVGQQSLLE